MYDYYVPGARPTAYLRAEQAFELGGICYPSGWLRTATAEECAALGIEPVTVGPRPDPRFYWVSEVRVGGTVSFVAMPKDLAGLKTEAIARIKRAAAAVLAPSDWTVTRAFERGEPLDPAFTAWRQAVRDASTAAETAIAACASVEELAARPSVAWPEP